MKSFTRESHIDAGFEFDVSKSKNGSCRIRSMGGKSFVIIGPNNTEKPVSLIPGTAAFDQLIDYLYEYYFGGNNADRVREVHA